MPKAIRFHKYGGPEVLQWEEIAIGDPGPGEARVRHRACGVNLIDVYQRTGLYKVTLPSVAGNEGAGVPVVYDSVGKDTFLDSLDCLRPLGLMVSFGNASGPVPPFELAILAHKGSLYVTRPTLPTYVAKRADLEATSQDLFNIVLAGKVAITVGQHYALRDAAQAHRDLEARRTTGSSILVP